MKVPKKATIIFDYGNGVMDYTFDLQELYGIIEEKDKRIDKAIEYIDKRKNNINECLDIVVPKDVARLILIELLDILKGDNKE